MILLIKKYLLSSLVLSAALFFLIQGCAPAISPSIKKSIKPELTFTRVMQNPDDFKDEKILWGGKIISTINQETSTLIEIIQIPLDYFDKPFDDTSLSKGRFLIKTRWFLDSEIYKQGKNLTVAGVIIGTQVKKIGEFNYPYPLIKPLEIKLWEPLPEYPLYYYDPFFYDSYYYDPYYRPYPRKYYRHNRRYYDW